MELAELVGFAKLVGFAELTELAELMESSCPPSNPHLYSEDGVYSREYFRWPAWESCLAVLPPSSCSLAERWRQEKALDFSATTENIGVINILLILNPYCSSYWEENLVYPSQNQDIPLGFRE